MNHGVGRRLAFNVRRGSYGDRCDEEQNSGGELHLDGGRFEDESASDQSTLWVKKHADLTNVVLYVERLRMENEIQRGWSAALYPSRTGGCTKGPISLGGKHWVGRDLLVCWKPVVDEGL